MVKWIKLSTQMFDDEKIKIIESMPDGDSILIIWIMLMTLAGKVNDEGYFYLNEHVPYTPEMLSIVFGRKISTVKLALTTFENLGMVEIVDNKILISNWTKHQSVEGLADIKRKEQARLRQAKHRLKQKQLVTPDVTLQSRDVSRKVTSLELEEELDLELEEDKNKDIKTIVAYLNEKTGKKFKAKTSATKKHINARLNEGFTIDDFKKVIDIKCEQWLNNDMVKFLRPETLFGTKFEGYLNEWVEPKKPEDWSYKGPIDIGDTDIDNVPF